MWSQWAMGTGYNASNKTDSLTIPHGLAAHVRDMGQTKHHPPSNSPKHAPCHLMFTKFHTNICENGAQ